MDNYTNINPENVKPSDVYSAIEDCCLVSELKRLKKSSFDAIDNDEEFSDFKKYMHVHRVLEDELKNVIRYAKNSRKKSLILVCGNVGDGKSHLISYIKHTDGEILNGFIIHNDATESRRRDRDEKEELARLLVNFKDENLCNDIVDKIIVAINLGVLSNFIDSEYGKDFSKLADYVNKNRILVDTDIAEYADNEGYFYHVNFGDYHIYRLVDGKVESPYIKEVAAKIFSESDANPFYAKYLKCQQCEIKSRCPVKHNYEMLRLPNVVSNVTDIIIETIIKDKIILSTRDLLNFFFDIIVHPQFNKASYLKMRGDNKHEKYVDCLLPSLLYEHSEVSPLLLHIKKYDFIGQRTEKFDEITTKFNNTDDVEALFKEYLEDNPILDYFLIENLNELSNKSKRSVKEKIMFCFVRLCKLVGKKTEISLINKEFEDFISDLFYSTQKNIGKLKQVYQTVKNCVYLWNNANDNKRIVIKSNLMEYIITSSLILEADTSDYKDCIECDSFDKFASYINVTLRKKNETMHKETISIDYDLYKMLKMVEKGYRPTARDNNRFISFVSFIYRLSEYSNANEEVLINLLSKEKGSKYLLEKNEFGYEFREV